MKEEKIQVLVADDERNLRRMLKAQLERWGYEVHLAETGTDALQILNENHIDILITDLRMPEMDGMELLNQVQKKYKSIPVIMITAHGTVDTAVEAIKLGAFDYITKPYDRNALKDVVAKAEKTCKLAEKEFSFDDNQDGRFKIIGKSEPMQEIYDMVERVAPTPSTVLISGDSGTGKELIARALFDNSKRNKMPYIRVNCAAIPPTLIESELFGYEKGAFTGAESSKPGRFELADGGTLFLDEVGEISMEMQVKLLRAIQEEEFERVGGVSTIKVDVRLITATNQDLRHLVKEGKFRDDLYYRLNVVHMHLPRLNDRKEDIPLLARHFLTKYNQKLVKEISDFETSAMDALLAYEWPGNIRELENVVERCTLFCDDDLIAVSHLPSEISGSFDRGSNPDVTISDLDIENGGLKDQVRAATANLEKQLIIKALDQTDKNVTRAAQLLKISRKSLQTKMKDFGLRDDG
ncbi:MAG: sigma-54-dependent Fis family transcriptional regulator [Deltaproteobacteria bacterium]|nr:sigma-54-dependent Fis family transcriptional regulator [Deltaproteobacteria bacterium]MBN2673952.1 sigma-54-dependent Fis family transcriptional regulator [Deltaproteobacteria bacterium]